jgi:hypothetical protein
MTIRKVQSIGVLIAQWNRSRQMFPTNLTRQEAKVG